jgi:hypothetical protein
LLLLLLRQRELVLLGHVKHLPSLLMLRLRLLLLLLLLLCLLLLQRKRLLLLLLPVHQLCVPHLVLLRREPTLLHRMPCVPSTRGGLLGQLQLLLLTHQCQLLHMLCVERRGSARTERRDGTPALLPRVARKRRCCARRLLRLHRIQRRRLVSGRQPKLRLLGIGVRLRLREPEGALRRPVWGPKPVHLAGCAVDLLLIRALLRLSVDKLLLLTLLTLMLLLLLLLLLFLLQLLLLPLPLHMKIMRLVLPGRRRRCGR